MEKEIYTKEEMEQFNIDEEGYEIDGYSRFHHCMWCEDLYDDSEIVHEQNLGYLCKQCFNYLLSRGEKLTIIYNEEDY